MPKKKIRDPVKKPDQQLNAAVRFSSSCVMQINVIDNRVTITLHENEKELKGSCILEEE